MTTALDPQLRRLIEQFFVLRSPSIPVAVARFESTSPPDAAKYDGCFVYFTDTQQAAYSNGTTWVGV